MNNLNPLYEIQIPIGKQYKSLAKTASNASKRSQLAKEIVKTRKTVKPRNFFVTGKDGVKRNMGALERNEEVLSKTLVDDMGNLRGKWK